MTAPRRADPQPLEADDVRLITLGTGLWALALLASILLRNVLEDGGNEGWTWVFLAGTFLGLVGIRYVRRRRAALARAHASGDAANERVVEEAVPPKEPLT